MLSGLCIECLVFESKSSSARFADSPKLNLAAEAFLLLLLLGGQIAVGQKCIAGSDWHDGRPDIALRQLTCSPAGR